MLDNEDLARAIDRLEKGSRACELVKQARREYAGDGVAQPAGLSLPTGTTVLARTGVNVGLRGQ